MKRPLFMVCVLAAVILAGYYLLFPPPVPAHRQYDGMETVLSGRVEQKEYRTSFETRQLVLYLSNVEISENLNSESIQTKPINHVICYMTSAETEPRIGSRVFLRGKLEDFETAQNPGVFDARRYYVSLGVDMCLKKGELLAEGDTCDSFREGLYGLRSRAGEKLEHFLSKEDAAVMKTMLLGDKETLSPARKELFQKNGIAHILAISGLHISLAGMGAYRLLRKAGVPTGVSAAGSMLLILLYGMLTGAGVSAQRAVGMFLLRMLAEMTGRTYDMQTALGVLFVWLVFRHPLYLFHSGFLLSFTAVLGVCCLYPALERGRREKRRYREKGRQQLYELWQRERKAFEAGLSIFFATMPVTLWYYYELPLQGIFLNLLVIPLMTVLMYAGMLLLCLPSGVWMKIPALVVRGILLFYEKLCLGAEKLSWCLRIPGRPALWQVAVYVLFAVTVIGFQKRLSRKLRRGMLCLAAGLLLVRPGSGFQVTFLDVGQGDCICMREKGGAAYLVDVGSSSENGVGKYELAPFLKYQGISELDAVFITHPDADHCNGLRDLLEAGYAGRVGRLLLPDVGETGRGGGYAELEQLAAEYAIPVFYLSAGMAWQEGEMEFRCLHPPSGYETAETNQYSEVLYMRRGQFSMLLTGDVEKEGERLLMAEMKRQNISGLTVLKAAHHGSSSSCSTEFLAQAKPLMAVISCGEGNPYGHPHRETLDRLAAMGVKVYKTAESGAIIVRVKKDRITVEEFCRK